MTQEKYVASLFQARANLPTILALTLILAAMADFFSSVNTVEPFDARRVGMGIMQPTHPVPLAFPWHLHRETDPPPAQTLRPLQTPHATPGRHGLVLERQRDFTLEELGDGRWVFVQGPQ